LAALGEPAPVPQEAPVTPIEGAVVAAEVLRGVLIEWPTDEGVSYTVEWSDDLTAGSWMSLLEVEGDGSPQIAFDEPDVSGPSYYRIVENP
jgi:hypothetical protein